MQALASLVVLASAIGADQPVEPLVSGPEIGERIRYDLQAELVTQTRTRISNALE